MSKEQKEQIINPIDGSPADERIEEVEAKKRGYLELAFILTYLEDENENVKVFDINGKKVVVHLKNPFTQYKKKTQINHERLLQEDTKKEEVNIIPAVVNNPTCNIDDPDSCESCGS